MPDLPATDSSFAHAELTFSHGPRGYRAFAVGRAGLVFARTGWHPDLPDALTAIAAAMLPGLTRSAHRDVTADDDAD